MEGLFENTIGQSLLCGAIFLIVSAIMYLHPPKKINYFYGYRTGASMRSQERWDFSQRYSSIQMAKCGLFMVIISFAGKLYPIENVYQTAVSVTIALAAVLYMLFSTEQAIKKRFAKP